MIEVKIPYESKGNRMSIRIFDENGNFLTGYSTATDKLYASEHEVIGLIPPQFEGREYILFDVARQKRVAEGIIGNDSTINLTTGE